MARIPIYQQQVTPRAVDMPTSARGARIMPEMGNGLQSIAEGLNSIGNAVQAYDEGTFRLNQQRMAAFQEKTENEGRIWAAKSTSEADLTMAEHLQKRQLAAPPGGSGFTPSFLKDFDEYAEKAVANAPSEYAKGLMQAHLARTREAYGKAALMWENQESQRYQGQQIDEGLQNSAKIVNSNPAWFDREMGKWRSTIQASTVNQEAKAKLNEIARKMLVNSSVVAWVDRNPTQALAILNDIQKGGDPASDVTWQDGNTSYTVPVKMGTLEERLRWTEYAQRKVDSMRQDAGVSLRYEIQNAEAMASAGVAPTGPERTREEFALAFKDPQVAEHEYARYTTARQTAAATASLSGRTTTELLAVIQSKPDASDPQFAVKAANQRIQAAAAANIVQARQDDPVAYAMQTGDWKLQPLNVQDTGKFSEELKRRAAALPGMAEKYGRGSMLSKPEATALAQTLGALPADQRVERLKAVRTSVSDVSVYNSVMAAIAKDAPLTALTGAVAGAGFERNARLIAHGADLLKSESGSKLLMPRETDLLTFWRGQSGNAYRNHPDYERNAFDAFKAAYASLASGNRNIDPTSGVNEDIGKQAFTAATGGVMKWKTDLLGNSTPSAHIVLPYGMPEDAFKDRIAAEWLRVRGEVGYPKTDVTDIGLENTGENGAYYVISGTGRAPNPKTGGPIILRITGPAPSREASGPITRGR